MTATEAHPTCCVCGADTDLSRPRRDIQGQDFCELCFDNLRRSDPPQDASGEPDPQFRCSACGSQHPARELLELAGQLVCNACVSKPAKGASPTASNGNGRPADAADEARQIVAHLQGSEPPNILPKIICPHCWHGFLPADILWVAQHAELAGDPVLGPEAQARFIPSRFNTAGEALDGRDMPCQILACPRCHLTIPRAMVETPPLFVSVVGAPASGKSHFLASMTWELRRVLRDRFFVTFNDADALSNLSLQRYEETLFFAGDGDRLVSIRKTELQGELYDQIRLGQQIVSLPRPFLFTLRPQPKPPGPPGPAGPAANGAGAFDDRLRLICLYDNAGEHFQPGMDSTSAPGTQHLAKSKILIFLFDPTQDPSFREHCRSFSDDPQLYGSSRTLRQETILTEAAARVRRYTGLSPQRKHPQPLLVVVSKADIWGLLLDANLNSEPLIPDPAHPGTDLAVVDIARIERTSAMLRKLLIERAPHIVAAAEDFCKTIIYIPSSALGRGPEVQKETGMLGIRPRDIRPKWAAAPILYMLAKWGGGVIPAAKSASRSTTRPKIPTAP